MGGKGDNRGAHVEGNDGNIFRNLIPWVATRVGVKIHSLIIASPTNPALKSYLWLTKSKRHSTIGVLYMYIGYYPLHAFHFFFFFKKKISFKKNILVKI